MIGPLCGLRRGTADAGRGGSGARMSVVTEFTPSRFGAHADGSSFDGMKGESSKPAGGERARAEPGRPEGRADCGLDRGDRHADAGRGGGDGTTSTPWLERTTSMLEVYMSVKLRGSKECTRAGRCASDELTNSEACPKKQSASRPALELVAISLFRKQCKAGGRITASAALLAQCQPLQPHRGAPPAARLRKNCATRF